MNRNPLNTVPRRFRPWLVIVSFVLVLFGVNYLLWSQRALWHAYDPHPYRERLDICRSQKWDLVVVGGSPAMSALDPHILAGVYWQGRPLKQVCNVAMPLATAAEVYHTVKNGILHRPRLLVYGICATEFNEDRVEPLGPMYLMDAGDVVRWANNRPEAAKWCAGKFLQERWDELCPMTYYRLSVQRWATDKLDECCPGLCSEAAEVARKKLWWSVAMYVKHGFMSHEATPDARLDLLKANGQPLPGSSFLENYEVSNYLAYLHSILDWAEKHRVPVVLVELPTSADLEKKFAAAFAAFRTRLREVEQQRQVRVLRPTRAGLGLEDRHYADIIHLNMDGAAILSAWLRRELAAITSERRSFP